MSSYYWYWCPLLDTPPLCQFGNVIGLKSHDHIPGLWLADLSFLFLSFWNVFASSFSLSEMYRSSSGLTYSTDLRPGSHRYWDTISQWQEAWRQHRHCTENVLIGSPTTSSSWLERRRNSDGQVHRHAAGFILNVWDFTTQNQNQNQNPQPPSHTSFPTMHPGGRTWTWRWWTYGTSLKLQTVWTGAAVLRRSEVRRCRVTINNLRLH